MQRARRLLQDSGFPHPRPRSQTRSVHRRSSGGFVPSLHFESFALCSDFRPLLSCQVTILSYSCFSHSFTLAHLLAPISALTKGSRHRRAGGQPVRPAVGPRPGRPGAGRPHPLPGGEGGKPGAPQPGPPQVVSKRDAPYMHGI